MNVIDTIKRALASAGLEPHAGPMKGVTDTIAQALSAAGLGPRDATTDRRAEVIDVVARGTGHSGARADGAAGRPGAPGATGAPGAPGAPEGPGAPARPAAAGEFVSRSYRNAAGTRAYKLYVPAGYGAGAAEGAPLVVMLHGCTQSPDDFAAGTRMNALADRHGFLVVYPEQAASANGSKCWNWFQPGDQRRGHGEPSLIAGITGEVAATYRVDQRRIFVAGLSAGAAMAVILGASYPELYAAVGAHSGLPLGAAHDMATAFAAMKGGGVGARGSRARGASTSAPSGAARRMPTIVFHGDRDHTVNARNGAAIIAQASAAHPGEPRLRTIVQEGVGAGGRTHRQTIHVDADGPDAGRRPVLEQWELHGAGHAWSGGSASGSFTDASGPDASAEMVRFFYSQPPAGRV